MHLQLNLYKKRDLLIIHSAANVYLWLDRLFIYGEDIKGKYLL